MEAFKLSGIALILTGAILLISGWVSTNLFWIVLGGMVSLGGIFMILTLPQEEKKECEP